MAHNLSETSIIEEELAVLQLSYVYSYCAVAIATLIFFDYAATVPQEVILVWFKPINKFSFASILFLLNRYLLLVMGVSLILVTFWWDTSLECTATNKLQTMTIVLLELVIAISSALRVYAFNERRWTPALLTALLGVVPACMDIYTEMVAVHYSVLYVGKYPECNSNDSISLALDQRLISAGRICSVTSELIVLVSTWYKTFFCFGGGFRTRIEIGPLRKLLLRDGTIYFLLLFVLNILEVVIVARFENTEIYATSISLFIIPFESIIMSHFLLSVRQTSGNCSTGLPLHAGSLGLSDIDGESIKFVSRSPLVGSMGEDLDFESFDRFIEEDGISQVDVSVDGEADYDAVTHTASRDSGRALSSDHEL